jgi:hypothetical protein
MYRKGLQLKIVRHENFPPNKKPVQHLLKRAPPALAEFIRRPQAEYQIGAYLQATLSI